MLAAYSMLVFCGFDRGDKTYGRRDQQRPEEVHMENTWRELIHAVLCFTDLGL